jgi:hypothetical protein
MRSAFSAAIAACVILIGSGTSYAQTSIDGFGALSMNHLSSFGDSTFPVDFGGRVSVDLTSNVQAIGEFGRLSNVLPDVVALPLSLAPFDVGVSAFYGEGGIRLLAGSGSGISPYVEGTAGVAHLNFNFGGFGSTSNAIAQTALNLVDRRDPMVGGGGGVLLRAGPVHIDLGYRYKKILANSALATVIGLGQDLRSHQVRFGVGVRF